MCNLCAPSVEEVFAKNRRTSPIPADPEGDRLVSILVRKYGLEPYDIYLDKVRERVRLGVKQEWPVGHKTKTRNANMPAGKRWGNWEKK